VPGFEAHLKPGRGPQARSNPVMELDRIRQDTGYEPDFTIGSAIADYIDWLRAHPL
jgi:UDP-glucose 4-epimerase